MKKLPENIIQFFQKQGFVIVSTIDERGFPHSSCKGLVRINHNGVLYLLDLYRGKTYANLKRNPSVNVCVVDEHKFIGYCLKGKAKLLPEGKFPARLIKAWEERMTTRITQRVLKNLREEKGHARHPEALLPKPEYVIVVKVEEIINLTPGHLQ